MNFIREVLFRFHSGSGLPGSGSGMNWQKVSDPTRSGFGSATLPLQTLQSSHIPYGTEVDKELSVGA